MPLTTDTVHAILDQITDPSTGQSLCSMWQLKTIDIESDQLTIKFEVGYPAKTQIAQLRPIIEKNIFEKTTLSKLNLEVQTRILHHAVQTGVSALPKIKNIIAIASGKGGVGKSTTAANLAVTLSREGAVVGLLDADIYGPSQPLMMGIQDKPESIDGQTIEPLKNHGVFVSSIGFLVDPDQPMAWRGPMVTQALRQLMEQTRWPELDYLIIDLPPGTGDIQLTLCQKIPVTASVIVTTPQDVSLIDAQKALKMFQKVEIAVLGVIENMSTYTCDHCGHTHAIFGEGGGEKMCAQYGVDFLGRLPLVSKIREDGDLGTPSALDPTHFIGAAYTSIAYQIGSKLAKRPKDMTHKFPKVVVEKK